MKTEFDSDKKTFTDFLRKFFAKALNKVASVFNRLGIKPNLITAAGLIGNLAAACLLAMGYFLWGGIVAMVVAPLDALDGVLARMRNESGRFGSFIDSITDRYSEILLYGGMSIYFMNSDQKNSMLLAFLAATGSLLVSYVRAKAEAVEFSAKVGLLTRAERYFILIPGLLFGYPHIYLWILAVLTHFTALQRIWFVRKQAKLSGNLVQKESE
jgi:CDP-diacylglycerol--glycerol-3-phosphate 3-phosphatidyltransferase